MPRAWLRPDRSPTASGCPAAETSSTSWLTPSTPCSRGSKPTSCSSSVSRPTLAITQTLLDVARNDPTCDTAELVERLKVVNTRAIGLTEALLLLSRAGQRAFAREPVDLSLIAEEATETLLPLAEKRGLSIENSGEMTPTI